MRKRCVCLLVLLCLLVAVGCAGPTPQQRSQLEDSRARAAEVLEGLAAALRAQSPEPLRPVLLPSLQSSEVTRLGFQLTQASWLKRYSGYTVQAEEAAGKLSWANYRQGEARLKVAGTSGGGERLTDTVELALADGKWWLRDFELVQPKPEDAINPPPEVRRALRPRVQELMKALAEGHIGDVYYALPDERVSRYRMPKMGFWQRLTTDDRPINLLSDLERFRRLDFLSWPETGEPIDYVFLGPGAIAAQYEIPYSWASKDPSTPEYLQLRFVFIRQPEGWGLFRVEMSGEAIPYS